MSKLDRHRFDAYYTNQLLLQQLLNKYPISKDKLILECCNGKGHISNYLKQLGYDVLTCDIDTDTNSDYHYDVIEKQFWDRIICDTVITNPPFNVAAKILENALDVVDEVVMLLRLSYLEPTKDRKLILNSYKDNLVKVIPISPRPKFRNDTKGSDSVTVAWFIWNKKFSWNKLGINYPFDFITDWK